MKLPLRPFVDAVGTTGAKVTTETWTPGSLADPPTAADVSRVAHNAVEILQENQALRERYTTLLVALAELELLMRAAHSNWADRLAAELAKHREV